MEGYRTDETAELRRQVEDLTAARDLAEAQQRAAQANLLGAEREKNAAIADLRRTEAELASVKAGGTPQHRLEEAAQVGFSLALYTSGFGGVVVVAIFCIAALFSSLRGCSSVGEAEDNATGVITDRYHYESRTYTTCSGSGSSRTCTTHTIPEHWTVRVAHDAHEREVRLSHETWEETQIGAPWCERPPCAPLLVTEER